MRLGKWSFYSLAIDESLMKAYDLIRVSNIRTL